LGVRWEAAVEPLDAQPLLAAELENLRRRCRHSVRAQDSHAQPFVFDRGVHVDFAATDKSQWQLEDMRCGCRTVRQHPSTLVSQEGRFLLCAGEGNAEIVRVR